MSRIFLRFAASQILKLHLFPQYHSFSHIPKTILDYNIHKPSLVFLLRFHTALALLDLNKSVALQALTKLGRLTSRRWQSFPTAPDDTGLTCGQHIEFHSCIFNFPNRTVTSLFK
jgi:hypothetical protein